MTMKRILRQLLLSISAVVVVLSNSVQAAPNQWNGTGPSANGQGNRVVTAILLSADGKTLYAGTRSSTVFRFDVPPVLSSVSVSGTAQTSTTLMAVSDKTGLGYWIVVPRGATAPTPDQVRLKADYGNVNVVAGSKAAMTVGLVTSFAVSGLTANTNYDLYMVAEDALTNVGETPVRVRFTTLPISRLISVSVNPVEGGTASCTPNPVLEGDTSTCTVVVNPVYAFGSWSGSCAGASCVLTNVTGPQSVTATLAPTLNVNGSAAETRYRPATDGLIVARFMQGVRGPALLAGASGSDATVTDPALIATYLTSLASKLDIDGNGVIDPQTDGLLVMRYMLGFRGDALITNALGAAPRARSTAADIEAWLATLMP